MDANPYLPPVDEEPLAPLPGLAEPRLATLGARFGGAIVDGILIGVGRAALGFGLNTLALGAVAAGWLATAVTLVWACIVQILWFRDGQSIGKRLAHTRIVESGSGRTASVVRIIGLRILPLTVASHAIAPLAFYGFPDELWLAQAALAALSIGDILPIFGAERRCLHDLIAGTKVVEAT